MSLDEFRCAVIGDEPAGLWLLQKYEEAMTQQGVTPRMAWLTFQPQVPVVCVPGPAASEFNLSVGKKWSAEVLSPERSLVWSAEGLKEAFPELHLQQDEKGELTAHSAQLSAIRYAIGHHPELLSYASGIWKFTGRTRQIHPESVVRGALMCTELAMWQPTDALPAHVQRVPISALENPIEEVECLSNGSISLKFRNHAPIVSHRWILNLSVHELSRLWRQSPEFIKLVSLASDMRSRTALYSLRLGVENRGIPCPVRPLSIYFDTEAIPDLETETWPVELFNRDEFSKELVLWASAPQQASLDAILDRFRQGMVRLNRLFPFLTSTLLDLSIALDMDSCASVEARAQALDELEDARMEVYDLTAFHTATRHPGLWALMPFVNCHLPYPLGTLRAAQALLPELVGKRKKPQPEGEAREKSAEGRA